MDASGNIEPLSDELLLDLQRLSLDYFLNEANPANGLIADRNAARARRPASPRSAGADRPIPSASSAVS